MVQVSKFSVIIWSQKKNKVQLKMIVSLVLPVYFCIHICFLLSVKEFYVFFISPLTSCPSFQQFSSAVKFRYWSDFWVAWFLNFWWKKSGGNPPPPTVSRHISLYSALTSATDPADRMNCLIQENGTATLPSTPGRSDFMLSGVQICWDVGFFHDASSCL